MGVIAEGILRGCQGLFTPVSLGYPLSVFNKNSTLKATHTPVVTFRVRTTDNLDEACTNADDRTMLVRHRSGDRVMS